MVRAWLEGGNNSGISAEPRRDRLDWVLAGLVALGCHLLWHAHGIKAGGFQNLDVAGIVYNARLLLAGRLPYVDSVEIKPPGAFLLFAPFLALGGLRAVWWFSVLWGAVTSLGTGWLGELCWGRRWGPRIAILHAAGAAVAADGDINYSFWMTLPLVLSAAFAVRAAQLDDTWRSNWCWGIGSGLAVFAVLVRPSAITSVFVLGAALIPRLRRRAWGGSAAAVLSGSAGAVVVAVLIALPFMHNGSIGAMIHGYGSVRQYADESITSIVVGAGGRLRASLIGLQCLPDQIPVYYLLLAIALLPLPSSVRGQHRYPSGYLIWVFALTSFVGISLTLRFFTHDNAPIWSALAALVLRPTGLVGVAIDRVARYRLIDLAAAFAIGLLSPLNNWQSLRYMQNRLHDSDARVARLCATVAPHLSPTDAVLAWGWNAWGVYEHCGRWAPGPIYKELTTVTTPNTNTCNRGYERPRFKKGPLAARFLRDLQLRPPGLVLVSDYYQGLGGDPLAEWAEAQQFLRDHYKVHPIGGGFLALLRCDLDISLGRE
jgi:hypothetical protein